MNRWKSTARKKLREGESQKREDSEMEKIREGESQKREDPGARKKKENSGKHNVFPMVCGSGGSKSKLAKPAGAEPAGQMRDEKCTLLWRKAH